MQKNEYEEVINRLFDKHYFLRKEEECILPKPETLFTSSPWQIDELQQLKVELNNVKSMLNDYNLEIWHQHTSQRNKAGDVQSSVQRNIRPELLTQAWCKFYENLSCFPIVPDHKLYDHFTSVHLCEAPGAFITSLNHWLKLNMSYIEWDWIGTTLNPYYEGNSLQNTINDDRLIINTLDHWYFGTDGTGDIMNWDNVEGLIRMAETKSNVLLVTADGSIDCSQNFSEQETVVSHLHYCEVITAINILDKKGSLLLKIFTTFEHNTLCLVYLLYCIFEEVHFNKPVTSKEGNSEVYLVCLGFKGRDFISPYIDKFKDNFKGSCKMAMFQRSDLPNSFIRQMIECSLFFKNEQSDVILNNIQTFKHNQLDQVDSTIKEIRSKVVQRFFDKYKLMKLYSENKKVVPYMKNKTKCLNFSTKRINTESYNDMRKKNMLDSRCRLKNLVIQMQMNLEFVPKCYTYDLREKEYMLTIEEGKPCRKILNSKFCYAEMLHIFGELGEIVDNLGYKMCLPATELINLYTDEITLLSCETVEFDYIAEQNNQNTLTRIFAALENLKTSQDLILFGYHLLSRFNVGLLFILAHTFESLEIKLSQELGCIITLRGKRNNSTIMVQLSDIYNALSRARKNNLSVLSIVPISVLCDDEKFYATIIEANLWIINYCLTCNTTVEAIEIAKQEETRKKKLKAKQSNI